MFINAIKTLFDFDTKTLIGVLVWGNIAAAILVWTFQTLNMSPIDRNNIKRLTVIRLSYAIGYLLFFLRGIVPHLLSFNIGNTLLYICFYLEVSLLLSMIETDPGMVLPIIRKIILALSIVVFNIADFLSGDPSLLISIASGIIFATFVIPTIKLLFSKNISKFKRGIGLFYFLLLMSLVPRIIMPLSTGKVELHTNNLYQTMFFIVQIFIMVTGTIVSLLFMKENTDRIIETLAATDSLTNIANRHSFIPEATQQFNKYKSQGKPLALLFLDLDHFKKINDTYGHLFGDVVLKKFTEVLKNNTRSCDLSCRYGGEEFIILLLNLNTDEAEQIADRIMEQIRQLTFEEFPDFRFTVSIGIVCSVPQKNNTLEDFIRWGDQAMYRAKKTGRNKIVTYQNTEPVSSEVGYNNTVLPPCRGTL
jgi:diguanylate cyclase (GGDEF)-like protein